MTEVSTNSSNLKLVPYQAQQIGKYKSETRVIMLTCTKCQTKRISSVSFSCSIISKGFDRLFTALHRSRVLIRWLNGRIESRENWTPVQNERPDGVGGWDRDKYSPDLSPLLPRASLGFSVACVLNSLGFRTL